MFIFLDESGDLGFDFQNKNSSRYFVVTLLICHSLHDVLCFKSSVKKTLRQKLNFNKTKNSVNELKGVNTTLEIKKYFYTQIQRAGSQSWNISSIIVDKMLLLQSLSEQPEVNRLYNLFSKEILEAVDFSMVNGDVTLIVDRCKGIKEREIFDGYLKLHLEAMLPLNKKLHIFHEHSHGNGGLQAVDLFCHGVMRKYSSQDLAWYKEFYDRIRVEMLWPKS